MGEPVLKGLTCCWIAVREGHVAVCSPTTAKGKERGQRQGGKEDSVRCQSVTAAVGSVCLTGMDQH
jgi:hypothetical protein